MKISTTSTPNTDNVFSFDEACDLGGWFAPIGLANIELYFGQKSGDSEENGPLFAYRTVCNKIFPVPTKHCWNTYKFKRLFIERTIIL